jgi:LCP family protein required for cell wall assembly
MRNKKLLIVVAVFILLFIIGRVLWSNTRIVPFLFQLVFTHEINLKGSNGHINILLLGLGSDQADEPNLTDTIIFASLDQSKNIVSLISIPRDLWVPDFKQKVNAAYPIGGLKLAKEETQKISGQRIDYAVRVNFDGFVKAINLLGGLDINVDRTFDDNQYPLAGKENDLCGHTQAEADNLVASSSAEADLPSIFPCRYLPVHFDKGLTHMDGKTALIYVRTRHANGIEGTDFARSQRQEKIIKAFKDKLLSSSTILNPTKVIGLYNLVKDSVDTDIKQDEFDDFVRLAQKMRGAKIQSSVIDYGDPQNGVPGLLMNPPIQSQYGYAWVLLPRFGDGNFEEIHKYFICKLAYRTCPITKTPL